MKNKLTLIKRSAPMCPECNTMQFILEQNGIEFDIIDIAKDPSAIEKYSIMSVPVMIIGEEGSQVRLNGVQDIDLITELMND